MQAPGTTLPAYTISALDRLQTPTTQLAGARIEFEIEIAPGVFKNVQGTTEELNDYLATLGNTGGGSVKAFPISLVDAQARITASEADKNPFYAVSSSDWNANTPGGARSAVVYLSSLDATTYAPVGLALDANDEWQLVKVNIAAGTYDTEEIRGLWVKQYGEIDPATRQVDVWLGPAATPSTRVRVVVAP